MKLNELVRPFMDSNAAKNYLISQNLNIEELLNSEDTSHAPDYLDLARLHFTARSRKAFVVLEFGVGWSTLVLADAIHKNLLDWEKFNDKNNVYPNAEFQLYSVDSSEFWIEYSKKRIPEYLKKIITFKHSECEANIFNGKLCHMYNDLPDINPDIIYLDAPDPKSVIGKINGLTFQSDLRLVMSGDPLLFETILYPRTLLIIDGRISNARFLKSSLYRNWNVIIDEGLEISLFELEEDKLGSRNYRKLKYQNLINE